MYHTDETIAAIASAPGGGARGIVRLSGPAVVSILERCFRPRSDRPLSEIRAATALGGSIDLYDSALRRMTADVYLWPSERSYTRQPAAEIHAIGSPPLLSAILNTVCAAGARLAEPGEFTLRAFLAGRLDLTQAEAVLGVIDARGQLELQGALAQLAGGLARPLHQMRDSLVDLLAQLEAGLDFAEEDLQFISPDEIARQLDEAANLVLRLNEQLTERGHGDRLRAVLVGWPNVGKSSLFNALCKTTAALVSDQPGTTRDYLSATLDLAGVRFQLIDTAGADPDSHGRSIGAIAEQLAASQAQDCEVRLLCLDVSRPQNAWECRQLAANPAARQLVILTKCDGERSARPPQATIETSALTGLGLDRLGQALRAALSDAQQTETAASLTAERCGHSLRAAGQSLARAADLNRTGAGEELIAAEVRVALVELGTVVGTVYTDDILNRIFSRFCIGK